MKVLMEYGERVVEGERENGGEKENFTSRVL
jgi:hypothetical protein